MADTEELARAAQHTMDTVALAGGQFYINVTSEMLICSDTGFFDSHPQAVASLNTLISKLPEAALPISFIKEKNGEVSASFGGLHPSTLDVKGFKAVLEGIDVIEEILPSIQKNGEPEAYVFGRNGDLNPASRLLTAWARSPMEAVAKLYTQLSNGFGDDERAAFEVDIHEEGEITMRSMHDWSKHPIKDISARLMDELDLYLESKADRDDMSMDFN
ncbi:hypothetical protein ACGYLO_11425 [Sulfitobacter sp. 1A13353]|uniref:hypothetical protein n=1 Tax=Sulfitobacter sp. 1A13353 TaxID=3368568 RepID=UPI0037472F59